MTSTMPVPGLHGDTRPDVAAFVAQVRVLLDDLPAEERDELLDGLEANLSEQVADGSVDPLPDPATYATELRTAAGLPTPTGRTRPGLPRAGVARAVAAIEAARRRALELLARDTLVGQAWSLLVAIRPAWWVLRAWIAVTLVDQYAGTYERVSLVPHLAVPGLGPALLVVAVVVSVLIGQGRLWPGSGPRRRPVARLTASLVLLVLNVVAVLAPLVFDVGAAGGADGFSQGYARAGDDRPAGLSVKGRRVTNLFAYDLSGQPIEGVQLFDQDGRPVALAPGTTIAGSGAGRTVGCPWFNGTVAMLDVFPLQQQAQRGQRCGLGRDASNPIQAPVPPLAQVPPVTRTPSS